MQERLTLSLISKIIVHHVAYQGPLSKEVALIPKYEKGTYWATIYIDNKALYYDIDKFKKSIINQISFNTDENKLYESEGKVSEVRFKGVTLTINWLYEIQDDRHRLFCRAVIGG